MTPRKEPSLNCWARGAGEGVFLLLDVNWVDRHAAATGASLGSRAPCAHLWILGRGKWNARAVTRGLRGLPEAATKGAGSSAAQSTGCQKGI